MSSALSGESPGRRREVSGVMSGNRARTASPARRRSQRSTARSLVIVTLLMAGIATPLEQASVPDSLVSLAGGGSSATAQTTQLVRGMETPCPTQPVQWQASGSNCVAQTTACPISPIIPADPNATRAPLLPSVGYPDVPALRIDEYAGFCEQRFVGPGTPLPGVQPTQAEQWQSLDYAACSNGHGGFAVKIHRRQITETVLDINGNPVIRTRDEYRCRLITQARCPAGLARVASNTCRAVQRRTWTCTQGVPTNSFNTCYVPPTTTISGQHPACGGGSPDFVALDCASYVGGDYADPPTIIACGSYATGDPNITLESNSTTGTSDAYWCEFNTSFLKVVCHSLNPPTSECAQQDALCLKRASQTGGCDSVAHTIMCRGLQQELADPLVTRTVTEVQQAGCSPCVILPFRAVTTQCPGDVIDTPQTVRTHADYYAALLLNQDDFVVASPRCRRVREGRIPLQREPRCAALDVCVDPPAGGLSWRSNHFSQLAVVNSPIIVHVEGLPTATATDPQLRVNYNSISDRHFDVLLYDDNTMGDQVVRSFGVLDLSRRYTDVKDLSGSLECTFEDGPRFRIAIEELWPDLDDAEMKGYFGYASLNWWNALSVDERRERITARGFNWLSNPTDAEIEQERQNRATTNQSVECNAGLVVWCRWTPSRAGYFRLIGEGAWVARRGSSGRYWVGGQRARALRQNLGDAAFRQRLSDAIGNLGLTATGVGLNATMTAVEPRPSSDRDWLFTDVAVGSFGCPANDVRAWCGATVGHSGNYTETAPIGIVVHQVRVATRSPNS